MHKEKPFRINYSVPRCLCFISNCILFLLASCNHAGVKQPATVETRQDVFADNIRITPFQTPEEELASFKVPPGFEVTLFASEPDISKPINMEFDEKGRLWVTNTIEYPIPAKGRPGRDRITILEDTDGDGKADKFTSFIDTLNIPIGVTPVHHGAIAYSIPNLYRFIDKDGDGKADSSVKLVGPFAYMDTHGMVNNLTRGYDGWIYACHGYANASTVAGKDGDSITMISGNTFRFREDGSRVEATTHGRINPFGYAYDDWGYLYSLDCHTKPIYQLIPGAQYPAQGAKPPSFGWAPEMMSYEFGSTANSGMVYYTGEQYPVAYQHNFYSGNVVTSRINRNTYTLEGSSPVSKREEDFLVSGDPWFRPVDLKTGPDGSIYVADFYNRIIGHYEVAKDHPGRDHTSGRIWKITYNPDKVHKPFHARDWSGASIKELIQGLHTQQLNIRMMLANQIVDVYGRQAIEPIKHMIQSPGIDNRSLVQGLWILYRLHALPDDILQSALQQSDPLVQVHALRILAEMDKITPAQRSATYAAIGSANPQVQRISAEVLGNFPDKGNIQALLNTYHKAVEKDSHLKYTILLALRNHLQNPAIMQSLSIQKTNDADLAILMKVIPEVSSENAAAFALQYLQTHSVSPDQQVVYFGYIGRYVSLGSLDKAIALIRKNISGSIDDQLSIYQTILQGLAQRGGKLTEALRQWGKTLAANVLDNIPPAEAQWKNRVIEKTNEPQNPWTVTDNFLPEGLPKFKSIHSRARGYDPLGVLCSPVFILPASIQMNIMDYDLENIPGIDAVSKNCMRIRLSAGDQIIAEHRLKRSPAIQKQDELNMRVNIDVKKWQGQRGYIELVDSSGSSAIGIGNIDLAAVQLPDVGPREISDRYLKAVQIANDLKINSVVPALLSTMQAGWMDYHVRIGAASALININSHAYAIAIARVFSARDELPALRKGLVMTLGQTSDTSVLKILEEGLQGASYSLQVAIAGVLSGSATGVQYLMHAVKEKNVPPAIVAEIPVREALSVHATALQKKELEKITISGVNERAERDKIITARLKGFESSGGDPEKGHQIFLQNCSMCHQVRGEGGMIGPQLEGIGNWGAKALCEKVLDPNRNISSAYRMYNIVLKNGNSKSGLYRRTDGALIIFANPSGQEFSINKNDVKENKPSPYTLMPDQFRNTIPEKDFYNLLAFLLKIKDKQ